MVNYIGAVTRIGLQIRLIQGLRTYGMSGGPERQLRSKGPVKDVCELPSRQCAKCMICRGISNSIHDASFALLPIFDWAEKVLTSPVIGLAPEANMAPPKETSTEKNGVGSSREGVRETDHGANPRHPPTQETAPQVIGVDKAITLVPSQDEAREEMAQVFVDTHAPSVDLEEQYAEDDNGQRENGDESLYDEDNAGERSEDFESESESSVIYLHDASEHASDPALKHTPDKVKYQGTRQITAASWH